MALDSQSTSEIALHSKKKNFLELNTQTHVLCDSLLPLKVLLFYSQL
jgi:hypothetical protein